MDFGLTFTLIVLGRLHTPSPTEGNTRTGKEDVLLLRSSSHSPTAKLLPIFTDYTASLWWISCQWYFTLPSEVVLFTFMFIYEFRSNYTFYRTDRWGASGCYDNMTFLAVLDDRSSSSCADLLRSLVPPSPNQPPPAHAERRFSLGYHDDACLRLVTACGTCFHFVLPFKWFRCSHAKEQLLLFSYSVSSLSHICHCFVSLVPSANFSPRCNSWVNSITQLLFRCPRAFLRIHVRVLTRHSRSHDFDSTQGAIIFNQLKQKHLFTLLDVYVFQFL